MNNQNQVRQLIIDWAAAVRKKDMEKILAHHAPDIVMYDVPEPFESVGIEAYRKTWDIFFKYTRPDVFDILDMQVVADEQVAFAFAKMRCADKSHSEDYVSLDFRLTVGLKKMGGQWIIVHEHHSVPAVI
jgi:ketosteroid isomerase-like protein